ncbi:MAG: sugar phosphate nucleotidyltransferase [Pseudomonadota bacterium]
MMKAMILAAGLGTRLRPATTHTPKPLFPIGGTPLIDCTINMLAAAGVGEIMINTHHLHRKMADHINGRRHPVPVHLIHEPEILGTGGALRNIAAFWGNAPLLVINGDVVTDINLKAAAASHERSRAAATLVCIDHPEINTVSVDSDDAILGFGTPERGWSGTPRRRTFTGIQIVSPVFRDFVPATGYASSIDVYREMIRAGLPVMAWDAGDALWIDTGTPVRYQMAVMASLLPEAFENAFGIRPAATDIHCQPLAGDGSDRRWYRLSHKAGTLVMVDHGIRERESETTEADAFIHIARHLFRCGVPVPRIHAACAFSGIVVVEDAGDVHLQEESVTNRPPAALERRYRKVIDALVHMATAGINGFDTHWTWQSPHYDRALILEKECRYFMEAYVNGVAGLTTCYSDLLPEFSALADAALENAVMGFLHRDFQSRNIMVCGPDIRIIDFQGGRIGPLQYDLASLLCDPYITLPPSLAATLLDYALDRTAAAVPVDPASFRSGFHLLSICRMMQALGAYGFLWRAKGKSDFRQYIPVALDRLRNLLAHLDRPELPQLTALVETLSSPRHAPDDRGPETRRTP